MKSVIRKYVTKSADIAKNKYIFNAKMINENLTVAELGITNNSTIHVIKSPFQNIPEMSISHKPEIELIFSLNDGRQIPITLEEDARISKAIRVFLLKANINSNHIFFIYNNIKIEKNDNRKIKDVFKDDFNIIVINTHDVIGA